MYTIGPTNYGPPYYRSVCVCVCAGGGWMEKKGVILEDFSVGRHFSHIVFFFRLFLFFAFSLFVFSFFYFCVLSPGGESPSVHALQADRASRREAGERNDHRQAHQGRAIPSGKGFAARTEIIDFLPA